MPVTKIMKIEGMSCSHCSAAVEKALNGLPGVQAGVDLKAGTATIVVSGNVSDEALTKVVEEEDYEVVSIANREG
jgi:copper chaperone CopZ